LHLIRKQLGKLEFGGESPLTIRARCGAFRYFPDPLGIVTAKQLDKLKYAEFELIFLFEKYTPPVLRRLP